MATEILEKPIGYFTNDRAEMINFLPNQIEKVLELGCGEGGFGAMVKARFNAEVWGIEYENDQGNIARQRLDRVFIGDAAQLISSLPDGYFDTVICFDVLEHIYDPYSLLNELKSKLKPNAHIISSIPNMRYFRTLFDLIANRNWDYQANGILDITHVRFFTTNSIKKMYENAGYDVLRHEGINASKSIKPVLLNLLTLGLFSDIKYLQFATVARLKT